ncbi:primosomal protein N' [Mariprofundus micogutta]|uniref:Replication restart protein PriA n=1 Tax=Mariprofundus micogutta TaxID=1921010 RepID=A0A1L8CLG2_9PROT|nr:primosomal protein N' [Mariprofundus micogutta]GAV19760.1 primosomal protein N' [Mariprofundus micogutta]
MTIECLQEKYVEVAVFSPLAGTFTYRWPESLGEPVNGIRVQVPFGRGKRFGIIASIDASVEAAITYKEVLDRLDEKPLFDEKRLQWLERVRRYYLAQPGDLWSSALGWASQDDIRRFRCPDSEAVSQSCPELAGLFRTRAALSLKTLIDRTTQTSGIRHVISRACADQLIEEVLPDPMWATQRNDSDSMAGLKPTDAQQQAIEVIIGAKQRFQPSLLFGRTGSGKTEVYLNAAESVIQSGGQVLVLVPEIGLTPMWLARLQQRFEKVALWHSAMTAKERLVVRQHLVQTDILIGTRSSLFLPLPRLALIVVDEEHDASFKQQEGMSYSARDMAVLLAQELQIPIVLGSATPSLESWRQVLSGFYQRLDLPDRIVTDNAQIVPQVVDMRDIESPVSDTLLTALQETMAGGDQSILFLNRRGYAPALQCTACGDVPECPSCSMRLTLHRRAGSLRCHTCGYRRRTPKTCESCGEAAFLPLGEGTEKLEEWLHEHIPDLRFTRFDRDVITSHSRLEKTLEQFEKGELDCLIGTQMLVKGHDFPNVTLVGVVNADLGVSLPDFRASERWWQQMTQVTGRAGRGDKPGRVLIQTRMPEAGWLSRISESEAESTLSEELQLREMLSFPPFARWVRIVCSSAKIERATQVATAIVGQCKKIEGLQIGGPMPCPMERVAGKYRIEVVLRDISRKLLPWKLEPLIAVMQVPNDVRVRMDVDPQDMM